MHGLAVDRVIQEVMSGKPPRQCPMRSLTAVQGGNLVTGLPALNVLDRSPQRGQLKVDNVTKSFSRSALVGVKKQVRTILAGD
jgi:hypothetical protein